MEEKLNGNEIEVCLYVKWYSRYCGFHHVLTKLVHFFKASLVSNRNSVNHVTITRESHDLPQGFDLKYTQIGVVYL